MTQETFLKQSRRRAVMNICLLTLTGCSVVDQYGPRAVTYNEEASSSKSSAILLNVLRAAYRQPLQFTDMSTVTGTASIGASFTGTSIPLQIGGPKFTTPEVATLTPAATVSGGPSFNIANLNTQEFYQGIQSPLEVQVIASYVSAGIPLKLL
jgi:hypothetical protein